MASNKMAAVSFEVIDAVTKKTNEWVELIWGHAMPNDGVLIVESIEAGLFIDKHQYLTVNVLESCDGIDYSDEPEYDACYLDQVYDVNLATLTGYKDGKLLSVDEQLIRWRVLDPHRFEGVDYKYRMASDERGEYELKEVVAFKDSVLLKLVAHVSYGVGNIRQIMFGIELDANGQLIRYVPEGTMKRVLSHIKNTYKVEQAEKLS